MDEDGAGGGLGSGVVLAVLLLVVAVPLLATLLLVVAGAVAVPAPVDGVAVAASGVAGIVLEGAWAANAALPRSTAARFSCATVADS
jgi:hypothetical protein